MSNELRISDWSTGVCSSDRPEGLAAALALWLAARDDRANPRAAPGPDDANASEVSQFSADFGDEYESPETPEQAAAAMTVWFDDRAGDWRTDFPPPEDFYGPEEGRFGEAAYARALGDDEEIGRAHVCTPVTNAHSVCRPQ